MKIERPCFERGNSTCNGHPLRFAYLFGDASTNNGPGRSEFLDVLVDQDGFLNLTYGMLIGMKKPQAAVRHTKSFTQVRTHPSRFYVYISPCETESIPDISGKW